MSENNKNLSAAELQTIASDFLQLSNIQVVRDQGRSKMPHLNTLIKSGETGLKILLTQLEASRLSSIRINCLVQVVSFANAYFEDYSEETGQTAISFLRDAILSSNSTELRH